MKGRFFGIVFAMVLFSCTDQAAKTGTDAVYAVYTLSGAEDRENITGLFRFFTDNRTGTAVLLEPPAGISLDGAAIEADSARLSGAFYEVQVPRADFSGTHAIIFKNADGKAYKETFDFAPFTLATELGETVPRGPIGLQLNGLKPRAPIRVVLTDTSFATADINEITTVQNGQLTISEAALRNVASGPVTLHLYQEEERRLQNPPAGGGKFSVTYEISREFELVDE